MKRETKRRKKQVKNSRKCEKNIKHYKNSKMSQRWLASVLIHTEKGFRKIKGCQYIHDVIKNIEMYFENKFEPGKAA